MKNCDEMVSCLFERREQYEAKKRYSRKLLIRTTAPVCCALLLTLLGFGAWQSGLLKQAPTHTAQDAVIPGTKDWYGPGEEAPQTDNSGNDICDFLGAILYNADTYIQVSSITRDDVELGALIGTADDFDGTHQNLPGALVAIYSVKDRSNLLAAELDNGKWIILKQVED